MSTTRRAKGWLAAVLVATAGCGGGGKPQPLKSKVVEDSVGGYKLAVPEGWEREVLPLSDPKRRWFAGKWKPANVTGPVEAILVHLMGPGCPAADVGGRFGGTPFASEPDPEGFSIVSSAPANVRSRPAFRLECKYKSKKLGDLFEASAYVETVTGSGVLITSRGAAKDDAVVRARLDAALGAFDVLPREAKLGVPSPQAGGASICFPEGFDEYFGPSAYGTIAQAVGASDVQGRQETISLIVAPPVPGGEQFLSALLGDASRGLTRGTPRFMMAAGTGVQGFALTPPENGPRYEVAVTMFKLGDSSAALCVHAAMIPPGRALDLLETVAKGVTFKHELLPALRPTTFGEGRFRASLAPENWSVNADTAVLKSSIQQTIASPGGGESRKRQTCVIESTLEEDFRGNGTPHDSAQGQASSFDPKKSRVVLLDDVQLPDGRIASRLAVATQVSYEFYLYARSTAGSLAQVHVSALPGMAANALKSGTEVLAATKFLTFTEQKPPEAPVQEASRKILVGIVERARKRISSDLWYLEESGGTEVGAQRLRVLAEGTWEDRIRRSIHSIPVEAARNGSPGVYRESVTTRVSASQPQPGPKTQDPVTETTIDGSGESLLVISRKRPGGEEQKDSLQKFDLCLPPDVASSDGIVVAIAEEKEGTYAFATVQERYLILQWKEYRVMGIEDVEIPAGKLKARRIEAGTREAYWVLDGKVVKAELGELVRKLSTEALAGKHFKE